MRWSRSRAVRRGRERDGTAVVAPAVGGQGGDVVDAGDSGRPEGATPPGTRGDHPAPGMGPWTQPGTTPHARGPPATNTPQDPTSGNNPARAGTTSPHTVRELWEAGTTPRARGPHVVCVQPVRQRGNNPARAGTTPSATGRTLATWEQPRTRGDHSGGRKVVEPPAGTTPHARGPLVSGQPTGQRPGNNPARAGTTWTQGKDSGGGGEQPRTRGDHCARSSPSPRSTGTTPHARGPPIDPNGGIRPAGNNPARAGTTVRDLRFYAGAWCFSASFREKDISPPGL